MNVEGLSKKFWQGQRVFLTGSGGFVGGAVKKVVEELDCAELACPRSSACDLTCASEVRATLDRFRPDLIVNIAGASGGIGAHGANPAGDLYTNLSIGLNLIEAARGLDLKGFVQIGSADAYSPAASIPLREDDLWTGAPHADNFAYAAAKRVLHTMVEAYHRQYGMAVAYVLIGNIYGPGSSFDLEKSQVIAAMIRKFCDAAEHNSKRVECWGTGGATRDFLYVDDVAIGILQAAEHCGDGRALNLGGGSEVAVRELADTIAELCGFKGEVVWDSSKPEGPARRFLDISRAGSAIGFAPRKSLRQGLAETIEWWREVGSHKVR